MDLGDKPASYGPNRPESDQMFMVPKSNYPHSVILPYTYFKNDYLGSNASLMKKFKKSQFPERGIDFEEFETSLKKCTEYQKEYRGKA